MRNILEQTSIDFMSRRKMAYAVSAVLIVIALAAILIRGLNWGVDFTGGYIIEVGYDQAPVLNDVRTQLDDAGLPESLVQNFGSTTEVLIRIAPQEGVTGATVSDEVLQALTPAGDSSGVTMRRVEFVGPQVGEELRERGGLAVLAAVFGILIYVWFRFEKKFSAGSVAALVHDVIVVLGVFALFQFDFDLTILAAVLAVIGYSLNDTIVVFDRLRENFITLRSGTPEEVVNGAMNQTLSRTIITSGTTLVVCLSLFLFGGQIIHGFALALLIGIGFGTYSSIYVASALVLDLGITKEDLMPVEKEGADIESMP